MEEAPPSEFTLDGLTIILRDHSQTSPEEHKLFQLCRMFVDAAERGDLETVEAMMQANTVPIDCSCSFWDDRTALYKASARGHVRVVQSLLAAGANANAAIYLDDGTTALHAACDHCISVEIVEALLQAGAQVDLQDHDGRTPLLQLLAHPKDIPQQVQITRLLLANGCAVSAVERYNCWKHLHQPVLYPPLFCVGGNDAMEEIFHMLIEAGADLIDRCYGSILNTCVKDSAINQVRILLNNVVDIYARNAYEETALHLAVAAENLDLIRMLMQYADARENDDPEKKQDDEPVDSRN